MAADNSRGSSDAAACTRCGHTNNRGTEFCEQCGFPVYFRREAFLRDNRWEPAPDELAVFFRVGQLKGVFSKVLQVGGGTQALIIQNGKVCGIVPPGEYTIQSFLSRLNNFFQDRHAEILVTRQAALPVTLRYDDKDGVLTAEFLRVNVSLTVSVKVGDVASFAANFMTAPGAITLRQIRELLEVPVKQIVSEFMAGRSLKEMAGQAGLRDEINQMLHKRLQFRFASLGLAVDAVDTFEVRHDRYLANRERAGSIWIAADLERVEIQGRKTFDELYSEDEWRKIKREEEDVRLRIRRGEIRQEEAELMHVVRLREIELYSRVAEADSKRKAIELNAQDTVAQLEQEAKRKGQDRGDEAERWAHVRNLARIKLESEIVVGKEQARETTELERERVNNLIARIKIRNEIDEANLIENEDVRRERLERLRKADAAAARRDEELKEAGHGVGLAAKEIETARMRAAYAREKLREDAETEQSIEQLKDKGDIAHLNDLIATKAKRDAIELQAEQARNEETRRNRRLEEDLKRERIEAMRNLAPEVLAALTDNPEIARQHTEVAKLKILQGMSADQLREYGIYASPHAAEAAKRSGGSSRPDTDPDANKQALIEGVRLASEILHKGQDPIVRVSTAFADAGRSGAGAARQGDVTVKLIKCSQCGEENRSKARYCDQCGDRL